MFCLRGSSCSSRIGDESSGVYIVAVGQTSERGDDLRESQGVERRGRE